MRCPDCAKFVSLETQEPESELEVEYTPSHDIDNKPIHEFMVTGTVRVVRVCGECGQELKETTLEVEQSVELGENLDADKAAEVLLGAETAPEALEDAHVEESLDVLEEGGGRYAKSYFGATGTFAIVLRDGTTVAEVEWSDKVSASSMDELV